MARSVSTTRSAWDFPNETTPPGSSIYYSLRLAPARARDDLAALHGWYRTMQQIPQETSSPYAVGTRKLAWWREEWEALAHGTGQHPLTQRLVVLRARTPLPLEPFVEIIDGAVQRLQSPRPRTFAELAEQAGREQGALFALMAAHGGADNAHQQAARRLGTYCALVEGLRDCGQALRQGRLDWIDSERLQELGIAPHRLLQPEGRERLPEALASLAAALTGLRAQVDPHGLPAVIRMQSELRARLLQELARSGFALADQRVSLTPVRKLWYAWRERQRR